MHFTNDCLHVNFVIVVMCLWTCDAYSFQSDLLEPMWNWLRTNISTVLPPGNGLSLHLSCPGLINGYCFVNTLV